VPELDDQHREIFVRADALLLAMKAGRGRQAVGATLAFLREYVAGHFRDEVELMAREGYPRTAEHVELHARFDEKLGEFEATLATEPASSPLAMRTGAFLCEWLRVHIALEDRDFAGYLVRRAARGRVAV